MGDRGDGMKKLRQKAPLIVLIALLVIPALFIAVTTLTHNNMENQFAQQLFDIKLPDHTSKIQEIHFRAGDKEAQKTQYYAVLLIRSDLDYQAIYEYYSRSKFDPIHDKGTVVVQVEMDREIDVKFIKSLGNLTHRRYDDTTPYKTYYEITLSDVSGMSLFDLALYH